MSESVCAEQAFSPETYLISLLVSVSGKTTHGLNVLASSKSISAYEMMITTSPTTQRRRPVQAHGSAAALPFDDISFETFPVVDVHDLNFLPGDHIGSIQQILVDGDTPHITEFGLGYGHPVYLGLEYLYLHCFVPQLVSAA